MSRTVVSISLMACACVLTLNATAEAAPPNHAHFAPAPTPAGVDWSARLPGQALASYFGDSQRRVVVIGAGARTDDLASITSVAIQQLRSSGRFDLIMDNSAIGDVSSLSDQDIVKRITGQPVDALLVIRVFGENEQASVVGTTYSHDGAVVAAFSVGAGATLAAHAGASASSGLTETTVGSVSDVMHENGSAENDGDAKFSEPEQAYLDGFLHYQYLVTFNVYTGDGAATRTTRVLRGLDNVPLNDYDLLVYVGKPDLAKAHRTRQRLKAALIIPGASIGIPLLIVGAALVGITSHEDCGAIGAVFECQNTRTFASLGVGLTVAGSFLTTGLIIGAALPRRFNTEKKLVVVDNFNDDLRRQLSLPEDIEKSLRKRLSSNGDDRDVRRARMLATWRLGPTGSAQSAGLSLAGNF